MGIYTTCTNYNNLFQKRANDFNNHTCTVYTNVKYNHTCTKEVNLMLFRRLSALKICLLKMKKIDNYGLNYHRYRVQPLVLRILRRSF